MRVLVLGAIALLATSGIASAHETSKIDGVQRHQRHRIEHARHAGQLTRHEYRRLLGEQAYIAAMERRAKADGSVSGREYRAIRHAQRVAGWHIYGEAHDGQVSRWRRWSHRHR